MLKTLDWSAIATVNFDEKRRKANGLTSGRELFAKAHRNLLKAEAALARCKEVEPILKSALIEHVVHRKPIRVLQPIKNPTETLGGLAKGEDDDGFYHSRPSTQPEASLTGRFEEVMETIPAGATLVFKSWNRQLGQLIFKSDLGHEHAIYDKSVIMFKGSSIENPGLYGLLFNTNLVSILEDLGDE